MILGHAQFESTLGGGPGEASRTTASHRALDFLSATRQLLAGTDAVPIKEHILIGPAVAAEPLLHRR